jgi:hypothetical protein
MPSHKEDRARRILILNDQVSAFRTSELLAQHNLAEFTAIVWNYNTFPVELEKLNLMKSQLNAASTMDFARTLVQNALERLRNWVEEGNRLLVIWNASPHRYSIQQSSGRIDFADFGDLFPFAEVRYEPWSGELIEYCGPRLEEGLTEDLEDAIVEVSYVATLTAPRLSPLFRVSRGKTGAAQIVGGFQRVGAGLVLFAPAIDAETWNNTSEREDYYRLLDELSELLLMQPSEVAAPEWVDDYCSPSESRTREEIAELEVQIEALTKVVEDSRTALTTYRLGKQLFFATGDGFCNEVSRSLEEFGFKTTNGPNSHADIMARRGDLLLAVEAKGIDGQARTANFRQIVQWTNEVAAAVEATAEDLKEFPHLRLYIEPLTALGIAAPTTLRVRGLLVMGTYRKLPVRERTEPDFPSMVVGMLEKHQITGLTGLQLFTLREAARAGKMSRDEVAEIVSGTDGLVNLKFEWPAFLELKKRL